MKVWNAKNSMVYQVLKGRSNSFLVQNNENYFLVDTGRAKSWNKLTEKIDQILGGEKLSYLILTHSHFDHVENAAKLKEKYGLKILIHENEAKFLENGHNIIPNGTNIATEFLVDKIGKKFQSRYDYKPVPPDILLTDKYDLNKLGFSALIIHTPGHTNGSVSVVVEESIALVGDALFGVFKNSVYPPFANNPKVMVQSWEKLLKTGCSTFLPGHGNEVDRNLLVKQYKKHRS